MSRQREATGRHLLETSDLRTNFYTFEGTVYALNGVHIRVNRGETFGIVGESGCGKSVTVRSVAQVVQNPGKIEGGEVWFALERSGDREVTNAPVNLLKKTEAFMTTVRGNDISMIFQEASTSLNPVLSITEQVGESFYFHRLPEMIETTLRHLHEEVGKGRWFRRARLAAASQLLERDLQKLETLSIRSLRAAESKGERVRLTYPAFRRRLTGRIPLLRRYRRHLAKTVRREVVDLLRSLGVPNPEVVADRYPHELSGGMQQRIVIAIALACHPTLLIADEPTSNLDVTIQAQILELIKELKRSRISSVLFITHDLGVVAEICDRVAVMYAGDVCEVADVRLLFKKALHPYTVGLLNSVPKEEQSESLATIPGIVPNLIHPPTGCRFHPRCPHVMDICRTTKPATTTDIRGHSVACHLYTDRNHGQRVKEPAK